MSYADRVAWITGASSGIGEALAYALHRRGARLILSARRTEELERVRENCPGDTSEVRILRLDLSETGQMQDRTEEALAQFGQIDFLFNNGGISQRSLAVETDMEVVRRVMEVNFFGTVALTKAVLPAMIANGGHIIVTSSVMGKIGTKYRSTYAASKHALHGYFDCLRQEVYEKDVKVTLVCPGYIRTDITLNMLEADGSRHGEMGDGQEKGMSPEDFAEKLLPKLSKGKEEIYIGGSELAAVWLKRLSPRLLNTILRRVKVT